MDSGTGCTLSHYSKSVNDTKTCGAVEMLEGRDAIQRDLDRLERWACANFTKFNKVKCQVLHLDRANPKYRLGREWIKTSPAEKDFLVFAIMTWQRALAAQKANHILGCIKSSVTSRSRKVILPLCYCETPPGVLCPDLRSPTQERHGPAEVSPEGANKLMKGLEHLSYEDRMRQLGLYSMEQRRVQRNLIAAFQYLKKAYEKAGGTFQKGME
ncbi:uncharacterized protein LOC127461412 [Manacus candei]|uniref:uncharacterized protein LOC127461412 n=1 Tax=Manacus candei TaxID=415023 RepID=UPI002227456A|nr:uncharacterized protein LOC127461412 [Manacus candei]